MYKQYIVGFMMIEGIILELDVYNYSWPYSQSRADHPSSKV